MTMKWVIIISSWVIFQSSSSLHPYLICHAICLDVSICLYRITNWRWIYRVWVIQNRHLLYLHSVIRCLLNWKWRKKIFWIWKLEVCFYVRHDTATTIFMHFTLYFFVSVTENLHDTTTRVAESHISNIKVRSNWIDKHIHLSYQYFSHCWIVNWMAI